jgi:hypothetical protein
MKEVIPMKVLLVSAIFIAVLVISQTCLADTFTVPLPVSGSYVAGASMPFDIDLGETLVAIHEVRFHCKGTLTAGLSYHSVPFSWTFQAWLPASPGYWIADSISAGASTYPDPEPFDGESLFYDLLSPTWDFLLDGIASGHVELPMVMHIPEQPPREMPTGYIEEASIIIEATVARVPSVSSATSIILTVVVPLTILCTLIRRTGSVYCS